MLVEGGSIAVQFIEQHFVCVLIWHQDLKLKRPGFVAKAPRSMRHEMRHHLLSAVRRNLNRRDNRQLRHLSLQTRACSSDLFAPCYPAIMCGRYTVKHHGSLAPMSAFRIRGARGQKQSNPSHPLELLRSCYEQPHGLTGNKRKLPPLHAIPPGSVSSQVLDARPRATGD